MRSASPRKRVRSTAYVVNEQMPADRAETQVLVFMTGMPKHSAGVYFALARPGPIDHGFLELVVSVASKHVTLAIDREPPSHVRE